MSISLSVAVPGAIPNLTALQTAIGDWLDRDDLASKIPTFIQMAEAMFNRELRTPDMEKTVTAEATAEDVSLPGDYLAMRAIYEEGSPDRPLKGTSPTAERLISDGTTGTPLYYTLVSGGIRLIPPPASSVLLTMDYFAKIAPLSVYQPSNWLLEKHPDAYLYGAIAFAEDFLKNDAAAQKYYSLCASIIDRINQAARNDRYGAGPLVPNGVTQVWAARA